MSVTIQNTTKSKKRKLYSSDDIDCYNKSEFPKLSYNSVSEYMRLKNKVNSASKYSQCRNKDSIENKYLGLNDTDIYSNQDKLTSNKSDIQAQKKRKLYSSNDIDCYNKSEFPKLSDNSVSESIKLKNKGSCSSKYSQCRNKDSKENNYIGLKDTDIYFTKHDKFTSQKSDIQAQINRNSSSATTRKNTNIANEEDKKLFFTSNRSNSLTKSNLKSACAKLAQKNLNIQNERDVKTIFTVNGSDNQTKNDLKSPCNKLSKNFNTKNEPFSNIRLKMLFCDNKPKRLLMKDIHMLQSKSCDILSEIYTKSPIKTYSMDDAISASNNLLNNKEKLAITKKEKIQTKITKLSVNKKSNSKIKQNLFNFDNKDSTKKSEIIKEQEDTTFKFSPIKSLRKSSNTKTEHELKLTPQSLSFGNSKFTSNDHNHFLVSLSDSVSKYDSHPDALVYKENFIKTKHELTQYLFNLYNNEVFANKIPSDTKVVWSNRMLTSAGLTNSRSLIKVKSGKQLYTSCIKLSTQVIDRPSRLRDVLIHEMCHAVTWIVHNIKDGHGKFWTNWAQKAMQTFPSLPMISRCHSYDIQMKYTYRCKGCGYSFKRRIKSINIEQKCCAYCKGRFEIILNKNG